MPTARTVAVRLTAEAAGYLATMQKAQLATQRFAAQSSKSIGKHEQSINQLSTTAGLLGGALAVGLGLAVKASSDFESSMSEVAATGQDARSSLEGLRATALQAGKATKFSATEAAGGIEALAKAGVSAKDIMGGGLTGALNLASVGNLDVAQSADVAAIAMKQFGLAGKDIPHVADLLAAGAGKATGEVSDMAMALKQSGLVASQFGVSLEENVGTLSAFANAGLLGSDAGTSFKTMLLQLASPSGKAKNLMKDLGVAAYDAGGNFVGIADLAEQLKVKLGPLSQAERDAALATIFGNDAIRAANVLYSEGGQGITKWTNDVNDSGFAAKAAAIKMDNLKGDIERLSGSVETALIGTGQGAQGPLRQLTQTAEGAVNAFSNLKPSSQSAVLAIGAVAAGGLLAVAGIGKLATSAAATRDAFNSLAPSGSRARGALVGVGKAAGVATAGLIGLQVLGAISRQLDGEFTPAVEDAIGALVKLNTSGGLGGLDQMFNLQTGRLIKDNINGISEAFTRLGENRWSDELGESIDHLSGTTDVATSKIRAQFKAVDQALSSLDAEQAGQAFAKIATEAERAGFPVEQLVQLFPAYAQSVRTAAQAQGIQITSTQQLADIMAGKLPNGLALAKDSTGKLTFSQKKLTTQSQDAKKELDKLTTSMFKNADAALQLSGAEIGYEAAVDDATKSAKENGKTLDVHTAKGRANKTALDNLATSSNAYRQQLIKQGAKTKDVDKATDDARKTFIKTAEKMGLSEKAAKKLADKYGLVDSKINALNNKTVTTKVTFKVVGSGFTLHIPNSLSVVKDMAEGGPVRGPGTGTSDSILGLNDGGVPTARVSNGEYVINAKSTRKYRPLIDDINADRLAVGGVVTPRLQSNRFPNPAYTGNALQNKGAEALSKIVGNAIGKNAAAFMPVMVGQGFTGPPGVGSRGLTTWHGGRFTQRFRNTLELGQRLAGTYINVIQGGFRPATSYSGTSHRGDAIDTSWKSASLSGLRRAGVAAWHRTPAQGFSHHIHGVPLPGHGYPGGSGIWQAQDYLRGGNGLALGGIVRGGRGGILAAIGEGRRDELVLPLPQQWQRTAQNYSYAHTGTGGGMGFGGGPVTVVLNAPNYVGSHSELKQTFVAMLRRGDLDVILKR